MYYFAHHTPRHTSEMNLSLWIMFGIILVVVIAATLIVNKKGDR